MSTCHIGAGVCVAAILVLHIFLSPIFSLGLKYAHAHKHAQHTLIKMFLSLFVDLFVLTSAYECPSFQSGDIFHSNKVWHAAEEFDSFDQYSRKPSIRNPSHILAWGKSYMTMWWIILQGIWGGSLGLGYMFKIHAGECSGTRSHFNSNSTFMPVCMCSNMCVCVCIVVCGENCIYSLCSSFAEERVWGGSKLRVSWCVCADASFSRGGPQGPASFPLRFIG